MRLIPYNAQNIRSTLELLALFLKFCLYCGYTIASSTPTLSAFWLLNQQYQKTKYLYYHQSQVDCYYAKRLARKQLVKYRVLERFL